MLTVLRTTGGERLCKTLTRTDDDWLKQSYDRAFRFDVTEMDDVSSIDDLWSILQVLEGQPDTCVIRGRRRPGASTEAVLRRLHDQPGERATFEEVVVPWIMLDIDGLAADPAWSNEERLAHIISTLPACFHGATYTYQWSSSAGLDCWKTLSCHLWFWLDRWSKDRCSRLRDQANAESWAIDKSLLNPVQIHYTASPVFTNCADPLAGIRSGLVRGDRDEVSIPAWSPKPVEQWTGRPIDTIASPALRMSQRLRRNRPVSMGFEAALAEIGPGYHEPILKAAACYVALHGPAPDLWDLRERLIEAIEAAVPGRNSKADYLEPSYLDRVIDGAVRKFGQNRPRRDRRSKFLGV